VTYWNLMASRTTSKPSLGNSNRKISTSDFSAQIMYQSIPQRVRAASRHGNKWQMSTRMRNSGHCKLHSQCRDGLSL
jgi:hypothetical protein